MFRKHTNILSMVMNIYRIPIYHKEVMTMEKREAALLLSQGLRGSVDEDRLKELIGEGYAMVDEKTGGYCPTKEGNNILQIYDPACYKTIYKNTKRRGKGKITGSHVIMRNGKYVWTGGYKTRELPKRAGFRWDATERQWWTDSPNIARKLFDFADYDAKVEMGSPIIPQDLDEYKEVVLEGLRYLAERCDYAKMLDGMGFGKSDTYLGHSLAAKSSLTAEQAALGIPLLSLHRYQLPEWIAKVLEPFFDAVSENEMAGVR